MRTEVGINRGGRIRAALAMIAVMAGQALPVVAEEVGVDWRQGSTLFPSEQAVQESIRLFFEAKHGVQPAGWQVLDRTPAVSGLDIFYGPTPADPTLGKWVYHYGSAQYPKEDVLRAAVAAQHPSDEQCGFTVVTAVRWEKIPEEDEWRTGNQSGELDVLRQLWSAQRETCWTSTSQRPVERKRTVKCTWPATLDGQAKQCTARTSVSLPRLHYTGNIVQANCNAVGNPCNPATGEKYQSETDLTLPWLQWTRHYHSRQPVIGEAFGAGWSHDHGVRLALDRSGPALIVESDGSQRSLTYSRTHATDGSGDRIRAIDGGWELLRREERVQFNARGMATGRQFGDGRQLLYEYDDQRRLTVIADATGRQIELHYDGGGRIERLTQGEQVLLQYEYNDSRLTAAVYADGSRRQYHYEDARYSRQLTGITAEDGRRYGWYAYDDKGRVVCSQHSPGCDTPVVGSDGVRLAYPADGSTVVTDALGRRSVYTWREIGNTKRKQLEKITDDAGVRRSKYTSGGDTLAEATDRRGVVTDYFRSREGDNIVLRITEADDTPQQRTTLLYAKDENNSLQQSVQAGKVTRYTRNARRQATRIEQEGAAGGTRRVTLLAYCEGQSEGCGYAGQLKAVTGPNDATSQYAYYSQDDAGCAQPGGTCNYRTGDLQRITNAAGHTHTFEAYDAQGRVLRERDANGAVVERSYHPRGWPAVVTLRGQTPAEDRITRFSWTAQGQLQQVTQPGGGTTTWLYDSAQRLTDIVGSDGSSISYTLDAMGNRTGEAIIDPQDQLRHTLARSFDVMGRQVGSTDGDGNLTRLSVDAEGNVVGVTDPLGRTARTDYDRLSRAVRHTGDVDGIAAATRMAYSEDDTLRQLTDPRNLVTRYTHNGLGETTGTHSPDTGSTALERDVAGNITARTDARGVTTRYRYDALNRVIASAGPDPNEDVHYRYDVASVQCPAEERFAVGRVSEVRHARGSTTYCHDRFGQVRSKIQSTDGVVLRLAYGYDKDGRLSSMSLPDGSVVTYARTAQGEVSGIQLQRQGKPAETMLRDITHAPFGPATGWTYGNGRRLARTLDRNYRVTAIEDDASSGLKLGFAYDAAGQLIVLREGAGGRELARYEYDGLGRLTRALAANHTPLQIYQWDATGNRTSAADSDGTRAYHYATSSHHLLSSGTQERTYDQNGNTLTLGIRRFEYNAGNRMEAAYEGGSLRERYRYNHLGERILREPVDGGAVHTLYDEAGHWLGDYASDGQPLQQAVWMDDHPVALLSQPRAGVPLLAYIQPDHLGTPRVLIDSERNVALWRWPLEKDAFGAHAPEQDVDGDGVAMDFKLRFPGQQYTAATGLYYNYQRDLDAGTGRYVQSDPIGLLGGVGTYGYVEGDPLSLMDPLGRQAVLMRPVLYPGYVPGGETHYTVDGYPIGDTSMGGPRITGWGVLSDLWRMGNTAFPAIGAAAWIVSNSNIPKDAYDPTGAKAPGLPGEAEGYCAPKGGERWVPSPKGKGHGWADKSGNVWVPSGLGGTAHGGAHWDVQLKKGGYRNVYPGGRVR